MRRWQGARLVAADGQITAMAGEIVDLIEANEALPAKLARLWTPSRPSSSPSPSAQ